MTISSFEAPTHGARPAQARLFVEVDDDDGYGVE
jgi:hypothetical protein